MGSGASKAKAKSLATDENLKKAASVAKTATVVASAVGDAEEGEGGAAAVGALTKGLSGDDKAAGAAAMAGAKAVGGAVGAEEASQEGNWLSTMLKVFSFAKKAKKMKDQLDAAAADGELDISEIAEAAAKSGVLDAAVGAVTGEESNIAKTALSPTAAQTNAAGIATNQDMPDVEEAVEEITITVEG